MFTYDIDGVRYTQTPIVLGQMVQLSKVVSTFETDFSDFNEFIQAAGDKLPELLAIVLTPEGTAKKDKNLAELTETLNESVDLETLEAVVTDFFTCNPNTLSLLEKIDKATGVFGAIAGKLMSKFVSNLYASSLQGGTSQNDTTSVGDAPSTK